VTDILDQIVNTDYVDSLAHGDQLVDVSHYQAVAITNHPLPQDGDLALLDLAVSKALAAVPIKGWFVKATEGYESDAWYSLWTQVLSGHKQEFAPYHRFVPEAIDPLQSGHTQLLYFLRHSYFNEAAQSPTMGGLLDWERLGKEPRLHPYAALAWLHGFELALGEKPVFYSSAFYLDNPAQTVIVPTLGNFQEWTLDFRLAIASYPTQMETNSTPALTMALRRAGKQPTLWQYSGTAKDVPGFAEIDRYERWVG
jgi:hypothetical protein